MGKQRTITLVEIQLVTYAFVSQQSCTFKANEVRKQTIWPCRSFQFLFNNT